MAACAKHSRSAINQSECANSRQVTLSELSWWWLQPAESISYCPSAVETWQLAFPPRRLLHPPKSSYCLVTAVLLSHQFRQCTTDSPLLAQTANLIASEEAARAQLSLSLCTCPSVRVAKWSWLLFSLHTLNLDGPFHQQCIRLNCDHWSSSPVQDHFCRY